MNLLLTIPWAATDWSERGRLTADTALPINQSGHDLARQWRESIGDAPLSVVYVSKEVTGTQTAEAIVDSSRTRIKPVAGLEEISVGLWEGLSADVLRTRFGKVYKRWTDDPMSVCPPEGEPLEDAQDRLMGTVGKLVRKSEGRRALVLGPMACGVVRCSLESIPLQRTWEMTTRGPIWYNLTCDNDTVAGRRLDTVAARG